MKRKLSAALTLTMVFSLMLTPALAPSKPGGDIAEPAEATETAEATEAAETSEEALTAETPEEEPAGDAGISSDQAPETEDAAETGDPEDGLAYLSFASGDADEEYGVQLLASAAVIIKETAEGYESIGEALNYVESGQTIVMNTNLTEDVTIPSGTVVRNCMQIT